LTLAKWRYNCVYTVFLYFALFFARFINTRLIRPLALLRDKAANWWLHDLRMKHFEYDAERRAVSLQLHVSIALRAECRMAGQRVQPAGTYCTITTHAGCQHAGDNCTDFLVERSLA